MSNYRISRTTAKIAKEKNIQICVSKHPHKKIDVITKNGVISIGDNNYSDWHLYIQTHGLKYANERRRLYRIRHANDINVIGSAGYYAAILLW